MDGEGGVRVGLGVGILEAVTDWEDGGWIGPGVRVWEAVMDFPEAVFGCVVDLEVGSCSIGVLLGISEAFQDRR